MMTTVPQERDEILAGAGVVLDRYGTRSVAAHDALSAWTEDVDGASVKVLWDARHATSSLTCIIMDIFDASRQLAGSGNLCR